jgi:beta-lactamase class A
VGNKTICLLGAELDLNTQFFIILVRKISISLKLVIVVLIVLVLVSSSINMSLLHANTLLQERQNLVCTSNINSASSDNQLPSEDLAWLNVDLFLEKQNQTTVVYDDLKKSLYFILSSTQGHYALYFEDLTTGASIGINEQEDFVPVSLLKVPLMIATLKEVEEGAVSLNQLVTLDKEDIDSSSGDLWEKGAGYQITVKDLLVDLIQHSDNTAVYALSRHVVSEKAVEESRSILGLISTSNDSNGSNISPMDYSNMLRELYFSNYLRKPFSELALTLMTNTDYNSQIPAGVPVNIKVAHKIGVYLTEGYYHDCGIVYAPGKPYILCVMSKNTDSLEADKVISQISKIVYDYTTTNDINSTVVNNVANK